MCLAILLISFWFDQLLYNKLCIIVIYQHAYTATVVSSETLLRQLRADVVAEVKWWRGLEPVVN